MSFFACSTCAVPRSPSMPWDAIRRRGDDRRRRKPAPPRGERQRSCKPWGDARWNGVGYFVEVRRARVVVATGKTSVETVHYVRGGATPTTERVAQFVRAHWCIENERLWVLDMAFGEDQSRHRAKNTTANMTTLRRFALSTVRQDQTRKLGVANSRKRTGFNWA